MDLPVTLFELSAYLGVGACAGLAAGLFGVGGGIIIVPALAFLLPHSDISEMAVMHTAIATSLAIMIPTAFSSSLKHYQQGNIDTSLFAKLGAGIFIGSILGVFIANATANDTLRGGFAIFELLVAYQLIRSQHIENAPKKLARFEIPFVGLGIGGISSLLGIGGGTMTVPYLNWRGINMRSAIATSSVCGLLIAVTGAAVFVITSLDLDNNEASLGYIYLPAAITIALTSIFTARLGASLSARLPIPWLKRLFAILLAVVALKMLL